MAFGSNKPYFTRITQVGLKKAHPATKFKRQMLEGKIKTFTDETGNAERTEILVPEGKIVFIKDYKVLPKDAKLQTIEIYSMEDELLDSISIITEDQLSLTPNYRFYYGAGPIGRGSGDIIMHVAQRVLGEGVLDPRYVAGSIVDEEVIKTIMDILRKKTK